MILVQCGSTGKSLVLKFSAPPDMFVHMSCADSSLCLKHDTDALFSLFGDITCLHFFSSTVLRSKEKIETNCYKFKTKHGSFVTLQSQWFSFVNPWTKEVEYIVSTNTVIS